MKKIAMSIIVLIGSLFMEASLAHGQIFKLSDGRIIHRVAFPQIAYGGGWVTTIAATNVSDVPSQVTIGFGAPDGSNLYYPFPRRDGTVTMGFGINPSDIAPKGTWGMTLESKSLIVTVGSMVAMIEMVNGKDAIQVQVTYSYQPDGILQGQAAVFPVNPSRSFGFQAVRPRQTADVGVAVENLDGRPADVSVSIRNMAGQVVASVNLTIPANGQVVKFITELAPELKASWSGGLVEVTSVGTIAVMGLRMDGGVFSAITVF